MPPKRGDLGRDDALVDAGDAVFEGLGDALDAADVAAVEVSPRGRIRRRWPSRWCPASVLPARTPYHFLRILGTIW
jgi:hypothetical protein